jgi:hypothetical protein
MLSNIKINKIKEPRQDHKIHKIARQKNPDLLDKHLSELLKEDRNSNLNPSVLLTEIGNKRYDVLDILSQRKKPPTRTLRRLSRDTINSEYSQICELILVSYLALQEADIQKERTLHKVLEKFVNQVKFEFSALQLTDLKHLESFKTKIDNGQIGNLENLGRFVCKNHDAITKNIKLKEKPSSSTEVVEVRKTQEEQKVASPRS